MYRAIIISFFLLCACTQPNAADDSDALDIESPLQRFAKDPFEESTGGSLIFFYDKSDIVERFGAPIEEKISKHPDRTSDAVLTYYVLQYDGLSFVIIESEDQKHSRFGGIEITGNTYALKYKLGIGSKRSDIVSLFQPRENLVRSNPIRLKAQISGERNDTVSLLAIINVTIEFDEADAVTRIILEPRHED